MKKWNCKKMVRKCNKTLQGVAKLTALFSKKISKNDPTRGIFMREIDCAHFENKFTALIQSSSESKIVFSSFNGTRPLVTATVTKHGYRPLVTGLWLPTLHKDFHEK